MAAWAQGNDAAGELLARRFAPKVYRLCLRMLHRVADAEDATQDTFVQVTRRRAEAGSVRDVGAWLATVAINVCRNLISRRREFAAPNVAPPETEHPPLGDRADSAAIARAIDELPEEYRLPLVLKFQQGLDGETIARQLGISHEALRVRVHRALQAVRKKLGTL
jgi:RNA polymerase sigma-70 factor (ECF subfamily)